MPRRKNCEDDFQVM